MAETVTVLLIGTGVTGASIGLALGRSGGSIRRIGYDPDRQISNEARRLDATDHTAGRAAEAAAEADLVVLSLNTPAAQVALEAIAGRLPSGVVILSTSRVQTPLIETARAVPGPDNPYLGAVPFLGPRWALAMGDEPLRPAADLFEGGRLGIVTPPDTPEGAVEIALDLATLLGASPLFLDAAELDSATATSEHLPPLIAAAVLDSLTANPGWRDQQRLVGAPFAHLTGLIDSIDVGTLASEIEANRAHLEARLEALGQAVSAMRTALRSADEAAIFDLLEQALTHQRGWRQTRTEAGPDLGVEPPEMPRVGLFERLLGGVARPSPKKR